MCLVIGLNFRLCGENYVEVAIFSFIRKGWLWLRRDEYLNAMLAASILSSAKMRL